MATVCSLLMEYSTFCIFLVKEVKAYIQCFKYELFVSLEISSKPYDYLMPYKFYYTYK